MHIVLCSVWMTLRINTVVRDDDPFFKLCNLSISHHHLLTICNFNFICSKVLMAFSFCLPDLIITTSGYLGTYISDCIMSTRYSRIHMLSVLNYTSLI